MLVASTSVDGLGFSGKAQNEQMFSGLHPKRTTDPRAEYMLFPPPTFCECSHCGLTRRRVAVCWRAILMITKGQRPHPRHAHRHSGRLHDPADCGAIGKHVVIVVAPLAGRAAR